ncbi:phenylalanine 4-monooxygenase [Facilibium subflavum]|uniref:phenylalanine 4-monooxygenase n=1 Tax=Facilibium subflavum TaxID=2219058 RepID=UPI000E656962|nr:phenylalanine 4-monooxygenase [Facilibium subflavum]
MKKESQYVSKKPDENGFVNYTQVEHETWSLLMERQMKIVQDRACQEYLDGLEILKFPKHEIPQIPNLNDRLRKQTGWEVAPVPALIGFDRFFSLLAERKFPCATFIRRQDELAYLQEPDIFHELFGHCPLLTHPLYADFMQHYGQLGVGQSPKIQKLLARFYWFTVEFGLIQTKNGLKCYGGGLLSSIGETVYALESDKPERVKFDVIDILRTPYRIDIYQPVYYVIDSFDMLYKAVNDKFIDQIMLASQLPEYTPKFMPAEQTEN